SRTQAEVSFVAVLETEQLLPVETPSARLLPELRGRCDRHQHFLGAGSVHLLPDNGFDLADHPEAHGQIGVNPGSHLADHARSKHEAMTDDFRLTRIFS